MRKYLLLALLCPLLSISQPVSLDKPGKSANEHIPGVNQPLTIGAIVPDITLQGLVNGVSSNSRLSSFGRELLILDFWATWCTACLHNFPKLDSLQQQFAGRFGVLLVNGKATGDTEARVKAFFQKRRAPGGQPFAMPTVVADTVLSTCFPHRIVPHYVWLNRDLQVLAITGSEEVTAENIRKALAGEKLNLPLKRDIFDYDPAKPLFHEGNGGDPSLAIYRSLFTRSIDGLATVYNVHKEATSHRYTFLNHSARLLYQWAAAVPPNRLLAPLPDSSYCYELTVPPATALAQVRALTLQDLDRYMGMRSGWEKRPVPCWVLVHTGSGSRPLQSKGGKPSIGVQERDNAQLITLQNSPLSVLVEVLNTGPLGTPVFLDESGITTPVNLELEASPASIPALNKALAPYGLAFRQATRLVDVFVITPQ